MRFLLTADEFGADAYRIGLVQEVVPGQQLEWACQIAQTIAEQAPRGVQETLANAASHGTSVSRPRVNTKRVLGLEIMVSRTPPKDVPRPSGFMGSAGPRFTGQVARHQRKRRHPPIGRVAHRPRPRRAGGSSCPRGPTSGPPCPLAGVRTLDVWRQYADGGRWSARRAGNVTSTSGCSRPKGLAEVVA